MQKYNYADIGARLLQLSRERSDDVAFIWEGVAGELDIGVTYGRLYRLAKSFAHHLSSYNGSEFTYLAIDAESSPELLAAFFGGIYAGKIPCILPRTYTKSELLSSSFGTNTLRIYDKKDRRRSAIEASMISLSFDEILFNHSDNNHVSTSATNVVDIQKPVFLQTSSGREGGRSAVAVSAEELDFNIAKSLDKLGLTSRSSGLCWMPLHHHMGLFYGVLLPLFAGFKSRFISTDTVIDAPVTWLKCLERSKISFTFSPFFGFSSCLNSIDSNSQIDLSCVQTVLCGGDEVSVDGIKEFRIRTENLGFSPKIFQQVYGMAECPCAVFSDIDKSLSIENPIDTDINDDESVGTLVSLSDPIGDSASSKNAVKEICISGLGVSQHVVVQGRLEVSSCIVQADLGGNGLRRWLRTNDFVALDQGVESHLNTHDNREKNSRPVGKEIRSLGDLAVLGFAGVFPQSENCDTFWTNLEQGKDLISEVPEQRWSWRDIYGEPDNNTQTTNIKWGGFVPNLDRFDAAFFNISPIEARLMDPMQRKLIEVTWQAVEDAGYSIEELAGKKVGVFVGIGTFDYLQEMIEGEGFSHAYASTGIVHCMAANRISYLFDFRGPSEAIDTACSSSLVAMHRASTAIRTGECEMAIVAGANALISSSVYVSLSNASMLSQDGRCNTFDSEANGYVRGEGIGAILVQALDASDPSRDNVQAIIKGSAVNHGGHTASLTAPNPFAQADVIKDALRNADVAADTISYIEAHGTATSLGDPIEINGLKTALYSRNPRSGSTAKASTAKCVLGSVKTNIGHLEAAAGIAGLIKILLSFKYKKIPAHLHLNTLNPNIDFSGSELEIPTETIPWDPIVRDGVGIPRRAGISSFGFGGVNAHVVLEEAVSPDPESEAEIQEVDLAVFSARTAEDLYRNVARFVEFLRSSAKEVSLADMLYTLRCGRVHQNFRLAILATSSSQLLTSLETITEESCRHAFSSGSVIFNDVDKSMAEALSFDASYINRVLETSDFSFALRELAQLWVLGSAINWSEISINKGCKRISIPSYSFHGPSYWVDKKVLNNSDQLNSIASYGDIEWCQSSIANVDSIDKDHLIAVFADKQGYSDALLSHLPEDQVIVIRTDSDDKNSDYALDFNYDINVKDGFVERQEEIIIDIKASCQQRKLRVINFWPLDIDSGLIFDETQHTNASLHSFHLFQSIVNNLSDIDVKYFFLVSGLHDFDDGETNLSVASLWGLAKTLLLEHPGQYGAAIDVDAIDHFNPEDILNEVYCEDNEAELVYRGGQRYVPRLKLCNLEDQPNDEFLDDGAAVVSGGLGALGMIVAAWLADKGCKNIILLSRRSLAQLDEDLAAEKSKEIDEIKRKGAAVTVLAADVANLPSLEDALASCGSSLKISTIFHLAGSYTDRDFSSMSFGDYESVLRAKVQGTWNLYHAAKKFALQRFVLFSSAASVWGAATGSHYGAANHFLDMFANYVNTQGICVNNINWGMWADSGIIPEKQAEKFNAIGMRHVSVSDGLRILDAVLSADRLHTVAVDVDWTRFTAVMNFNRPHRLLDNVGNINDKHESDSLDENKLDELRSMSPDDKISSLELLLTNTLCEILGIKDVSLLARDTGFFDLGLDSLTSIDLKNKLKKRLGIDLSTTTLFDHSTVKLLAECIAVRYLSDDITSDQDDRSHLDDVEELTSTEDGSLDELSDSDLLALLAEEMTAADR